MIAASQPVLTLEQPDRLASQLKGDVIVCGWNMETYFYEYAAARMLSVARRNLLRVRYQKLDEANLFWSKPANTEICTCELQEILGSDGHWRRADTLKPGDRLQHWCGNGHDAEVKAVEQLGEGDCVSVAVKKIGTITVGGLILKVEEE